MSIQELINNINNAFCEFERYIKVILNFPNYKPELLYWERVIK